MKYIIFILSIIILSCNDDDNKEELFGGYPEGMTVVDMHTQNDCSLDKCSEDRVLRLLAENVIGELFEIEQGEFIVSYPFTFDSAVRFYLCDLPPNLHQTGLEIKFSGHVIDACGVYEPVWPVEEAYIVRVSDAELN